MAFNLKRRSCLGEASLLFFFAVCDSCVFMYDANLCLLVSYGILSVSHCHKVQVDVGHLLASLLILSNAQILVMHI